MKKYFIISIALLLSSCAPYPDEMDETIFIPDNKDENLPAYTEWANSRRCWNIPDGVIFQK